MTQKFILCILILILSQGCLRVESLSLSTAVLDKLKSIVKWLDATTDASIFDYIYRVNRGAGLNLFEGDIKGYNRKQPVLRTAITNHDQLWNTRVVPYVIDSVFDSTGRGHIQAAIDEYHQKTCIRWVPRTSETDHVVFKQISGCYSNIGRTGGAQDISLMGACLRKGSAVHEMMHALGFWHEQSRPDRDSWVHIITTNIQSGKEYNFDKLDPNQVDTLGVQYDYTSVMHYSKYAFSKNGNPTIMPTRPDGNTIGQREGLSDHDVERIRKLYGCDIQAATPAPTNPPQTNPPQTNPPQTNPPVTNPPATAPPKTNPPLTNPPVTAPPQTNPPVTNPPQTKPPVTNPPVTNPPVTNPPVTNPPVTNPPITNPPVTAPQQTNPPVTAVPITNQPVTAPVQTNPPVTQPPPPIYQIGWSNWSQWSMCDLQCKHSRYRVCLNYDYNYCLGSNTEVVTCPAQCTPAASFGCWSYDSKIGTIPSVEGLDSSLMDPYKGRSEPIRKCGQYAKTHGYNIFAVFNGGQCLTGPHAAAEFTKPGASNKCDRKGVGSSESINVYTFDPDIDGQWSSWSDYGHCTRSCGLGRQYRYRRCDNPPPLGNGKPCVGESRDVAVCNFGTCIAPIKCGTRFYAGRPGSSGLIWMRDYENFMECEYEISTGDPLATISILIHEIDIEPSKGCIYDTLMLYDGHNAHAPLVGTYCGNKIPGAFESTTNHVYLKFTSDETNTFSGYTIFYTINSRSHKFCTSLPQLAHGTVAMEGTMVGNRAWYSCAPGYKIVGNSPITCVDQPGFALWNDKIPRCVYVRKRSIHDSFDSICDFQHTLCGYNNDVDNDFMWNVKRIDINDNITSSHGNILHAVSDLLQEPGARARIRTGTFSGFSTWNCLTFTYKVDGGDLATFNVYKTENKAENSTMDIYVPGEEVLLMKETGSENDSWLVTSLTIETESEFQILFEAVLGDEIGSSISIDDVILTRGRCDGQTTV
ncbi:hypothetical protein ACF0H5_017696 [Mactra antiquata]